MKENNEKKKTKKKNESKMQRNKEAVCVASIHSKSLHWKKKKNVVHFIYSESNLRLQLDSKSTVLQYDKKVLH